MRDDAWLRLTETDRLLVKAVAADPDGLCETKAQLARRLGRCVRTVDRSVRRLREAGLIEVELLADDDGRTLCNAYTLAPMATRAYEELREESRCPKRRNPSFFRAPTAAA